MKYILTTILLFTSLFIFAQDNIVPLEDTNQLSPFTTPKIYYKDINGVLDKFIGTWKYQNTAVNPTEIFEITFSKRERRDQGNISYTDELVSQFRYTVNGTVIFDTYLDDYYEHISGSTFIANSNNTKMRLFYTEPIIDGRRLRDNPKADLFIEFQSNNGASQLKWYNYAVLNPDSSSPFRIPLLMTLNKI